jgi:hypothetical protein
MEAAGAFTRSLRFPGPWSILEIISACLLAMAVLSAVSQVAFALQVEPRGFRFWVLGLSEWSVQAWFPAMVLLSAASAAYQASLFSGYDTTALGTSAVGNPGRSRMLCKLAAIVGCVSMVAGIVAGVTILFGEGATIGYPSGVASVTECLLPVVGGLARVVLYRKLPAPRPASRPALSNA